MPRPRALSALLACAVGFLGAFAGSAPAATTEIGAVGEIAESSAPAPTSPLGEGLYVVQAGEATGSFAVPAGYGVITAWRHRAGSATGDLTLKVYRPMGPPGSFLTVAASDRTVRADGVNEFPVRIPVKAGDRLGLSTRTVDVAYNTFNPLDQLGFFPFASPDPAPGTPATLDGPPGSGYKAAVAARIETDADGDGFGDDTQDGCPTSATTQGTCPGVTLPPFDGCPDVSTNLIQGGAGDDRLPGTTRGDRIFAAAGRDSATGEGGADCLDLGPDADSGQGGDGNDLVLGGSGPDRIGGGAGDDRLRGDADDDRIGGGSGRDRLAGGSGRDRLAGGGGGDRIGGGSGGDRLLGGSGNDRLSGGGSGDRLLGGPGRDRLTGASGNDRLAGGGGRDRLVGGGGRDRLVGGSGSDRIVAGPGNDRIGTRDGRRDRVSCGPGRDTVRADRSDRVARNCERVRRR